MDNLTKLCSKCKQSKSLDSFYKDKRRNNQPISYCKPCKLTSKTSYNKTWYESNKAYMKAYAKTEQFLSYQATYRKLNRARYNAHCRKYELSKLNRTPLWLTPTQLAEIKEFYVLAKELQWLSNPTDPLEVDHIIPLQGENVSGLHVPWNLQIVPRSLNRSKGNQEGRT